MVRRVAGAIGVLIALIFLGYMAVWIAAVPYWIVTLIGAAMIVFGFIDEMREPPEPGSADPASSNQGG
jgi:hypothetical protein